METWLEEKVTQTLKRKKTYKEVTENSDARRWKIWSRNWKNKLRRRRNVSDKSQSESKKFDAIDVGL